MVRRRRLLRVREAPVASRKRGASARRPAGPTCATVPQAARFLGLPGFVNGELLHVGRSLHFHARCFHRVLNTTSEERVEVGA